MKIKQVRVLFILPVCLLLFNALEEIAVYKLRQWITNDFLYTGALLIVFALGFGIIGSVVAPKVAKLIEQGHKNTQKNAGKTGVFIFFLTAFALIYLLYFVIYTKAEGVKYILPPSWR